MTFVSDERLLCDMFGHMEVLDWCGD